VGFVFWRVLQFAFKTSVSLFMNTAGVFVLPPYILSALAYFVCNAPGALSGLQQPPYYGVYGPAQEVVVWLRWWDALRWGLARRFQGFFERVCIGARTSGQKIARMRKELPNSL
jgi:hypothetical protein